MITRRHMLAGSAATLAAPPMLGTAFAQGAAARITILVDAFGEASNLKRGWGYSAFIEYGGRRILFDTGSRGADFANNANALGVDLKKLDFVVVSHRHNDHTGGLSHVLSENPDVPVYTPFEVAGFNSPLGPAFDKMTKRDIPSSPSSCAISGAVRLSTIDPKRHGKRRNSYRSLSKRRYCLDSF